MLNRRGNIIKDFALVEQLGEILERRIHALLMVPLVDPDGHILGRESNLCSALNGRHGGDQRHGASEGRIVAFKGDRFDNARFGVELEEAHIDDIARRVRFSRRSA